MTKGELSTVRRIVGTIVSCSMVLFLLSACGATTNAPKAGLVGEKAPLAQSGFLGDYSQLKPGGEGRPGMVYVNPKTNWSSYHSVILDPVQFWSSSNSVPVSDQKVLTSYFYDELRKNLQEHFTLVNKPGPGVMELKVAITGATAATPVLRSVSVVVPQARVLNTAQSLATGSYAFVGSAEAEGEILDSVTGKRLAEAIDRREGGMSIKTAAQWKWGDAQNVLDYWAKKIPEKIVALQERDRTGN